MVDPMLASESPQEGAIAGKDCRCVYTPKATTLSLAKKESVDALLISTIAFYGPEAVICSLLSRQGRVSLMPHSNTGLADEIPNSLKKWQL